MFAGSSHEKSRERILLDMQRYGGICRQSAESFCLLQGVGSATGGSPLSVIRNGLLWPGRSRRVSKLFGRILWSAMLRGRPTRVIDASLIVSTVLIGVNDGCELFSAR